MQRKLLTVLFGQSGLGKTSILRAGLVPRLRGHGYCPIYVRIAYSARCAGARRADQAGDPRRPRATPANGRRPGSPSAGESLWEFLHHRDDVLLDEAGKPLIPLLIFDQFEEIFTLAQTDEAGRARAARFIDDLADLVENRAPRELEAKLEADDSTAERFDFARGDYRVLISLREDYLAPLESLKAKMPSITQNRLRLAPMTGRQGLEAVMGPGKGLVSQEVAEAIVRFVAGGAEIPNARGRALAAQPHLPRAQRHAHRRGTRRDLARAAGRLARLDPRQFLRARARGPAGGRAPDHRGRAADRIRLPREHLRRKPCVRTSPPRAPRPRRWRRSSTGGCCASRSGSTCAASN